MTSDAYKRAGVDIDTAGRLVDTIKTLAASTRRTGMHGDIGGFGALFDLAAAGYRDPILVASTDGVGTKLKVAFAADVHDTIGIDLVAMSVNDLVVQGAEPLFFLDYFATGGLDAERAAQVIAGIAAGCREARCGLIGGETAEMPGMYAKGEYDLAGFAVGAVERSAVIDGRTVQSGDVVLGLASTGVHSNGYSLVRKIVADAGLDYAASAPFAPGKTLAQGLLAPTRIYVQSCLAAIRGGGVKALAHITGGGLIENVPRVIPDGLATEIDAKCWPLLPVFEWLARTGRLTARDLARTFNCGIGMVVVAAPEKSGAVTAAFRAGGETVYEIGRIIPANGGETVRVLNAQNTWPVAAA